MKQHIVRIGLGIVLLLVFLAHAAQFNGFNIPFVSRLDSIIDDTRLRLTNPRTLDSRIVILDIDEKSLGKLGRWPWSRDKIATLIDKLFNDYGIAIVGFDVVFAEPDNSSGMASLSALAGKELSSDESFKAELEKLKPQLDYDGRFAKAISGKAVVLGFYLSSEANAEKSGALPPPVLPAGTFKGRQIDWAKWIGHGGNLKPFQDAALSAGLFNPFVDEDGVVRQVPMISEYDGKYYESLSLAMFRALLGGPKVEPGYPNESILSKNYTGMEWLELHADGHALRIPVDKRVGTIIPYRGDGGPTGGSFKYISLSDVYEGKVPKEALKGKIAFWGTSAPGLQDLRSTPVGGAYPGVEIHANLLSGMLSQHFKEKPGYTLGAEVLLLLLGGLVLAVLMPFLSPARATLVALIGMALIILINYYVYTSGNVILPLASSLLMTTGLFTLNMAYGYFVESRSKRQFTELFGQYVPPELVDEMARNPTQYTMEPKSEDLTILFSDVRGFTSISENLSPDDLRSFINQYLTEMSAAISHHRGTLDKYIGDAVMAFWGAPVPDAEHARQGVITALEMQKAAHALDEKFVARGWPALKIGIGVNSGNVRVGDMGSKVRKAYTVMGDPVNLASRLEGRTKEYGVGILVGENTEKIVKDVIFKELDRVRVKGKNEPVAIFEPICLEAEADKKIKDELKLWRDTLKAYRTQAWDQVEVNLLNLTRMNPDCYLYEEYGRRVIKYRKNPPGPGWDGVTTFDEK
ncbi:MAG TPA: adenylate/guanylate cyclase domain-containing protein [Burkholderiales bacterium]|nr:adenylate/guanylate cyclase domain-containing protein [Burkholderiales bacterium]